MTEDRLNVAVAALEDRLLLPLADAILMRWLRAMYRHELKVGDLDDAYRVRAEWYEVAYRMEILMEEITKRAEIGRTDAELEAAVARFGSVG